MLEILTLTLKIKTSFDSKTNSTTVMGTGKFPGHYLPQAFI